MARARDLTANKVAFVLGGGFCFYFEGADELGEHKVDCCL